MRKRTPKRRIYERNLGVDEAWNIYIYDKGNYPFDSGDSRARAENGEWNNLGQVYEEELKAPTRRSRLSPRTIGDSVLGLSEGLTVPFALTAGSLSSDSLA